MEMSKEGQTAAADSVGQERLISSTHRENSNLKFLKS